MVIGIYYRGQSKSKALKNEYDLIREDNLKHENNLKIKTTKEIKTT